MKQKVNELTAASTLNSCGDRMKQTTGDLERRCDDMQEALRQLQQKDLTSVAARCEQLESDIAMVRSEHELLQQEQHRKWEASPYPTDFDCLMLSEGEGGSPQRTDFIQICTPPHTHTHTSNLYSKVVDCTDRGTSQDAKEDISLMLNDGKRVVVELLFPTLRGGVWREAPEDLELNGCLCGHFGDNSKQGGQSGAPRQDESMISGRFKMKVLSRSGPSSLSDLLNL